MDLKEFERLYQSLFQLAWNSGDDLFGHKHYVERENKALIAAAELINYINIQMSDSNSIMASYHFRTDIKIQKSNIRFLVSENLRFSTMDSKILNFGSNKACYLSQDEPCSLSGCVYLPSHPTPKSCNFVRKNIRFTEIFYQKQSPDFQYLKIIDPRRLIPRV